MSYFYISKTDTFINDSVNFIPANAIKIKDEIFFKVLSLREAGRLYKITGEGELEIFPPAPSPIHKWDGSKWIIDPEDYKREIIRRKKNLIKKLKNTADLASKPLFDEFPFAEINSFSIQKAEALAYKSGENLKPTFLMSIAEKRKIPVPELVDKVIIKTGRYEKIMGEIAGKRQFIMDKFDHAVNKSDLDEINGLIDTWLEKIKKEQGAG